MDGAELAAVITGAGWVLSAAAGVLIKIRKVRIQARETVEDELRGVERLLEVERMKRLEVERMLYRASVLMAQHGIDLPGSDP